MYAMLRRGLPLAALIAGLTLLLGPAGAADDAFKPLFNGKDFSGLKFELKGDPEKTFSVKDGVIVVSGKPAGYFYTDKPYKNYVLVFDWKFARPEKLEDEEKFAGNSGTLIHIQEPHKVWPKCVEVQGMNRAHGQIFAIGGAKGKFDFDGAALKKARHKVGEWNTTEVTVKDGHITSKVNGAQVSDGEGDVKEGPIGWQSEGAEIHFRNLKIKELK